MAIDKYTNGIMRNYILGKLLKKKKSHKCEDCVWGTWTGLKYKCALPRCIPSLGDFNREDPK